MSEKRHLEFNSNEFGKLVRSFRLQRGWSQGDLAERWGHTREYVSLIERGKRKVDKLEQISRLAEILEIPQERLDAIGKTRPPTKLLADKPSEANDILLQTLLEPSLATAKLSWLLWLADGKNQPVVESLEGMIENLEGALTKYHGQFMKPAQKVLAYAHEMMGRIAYDQLRFTQASGHFQEMFDLGEELHDVDIMCLAQIHQADVQRKRGRYEAAVKILHRMQPIIDVASTLVQGVRWQILARAHAAYGFSAEFLDAIQRAEECAHLVKDNLDTQYNQFNRIEVLQEKAQGHTLLWEPEKALEIYAYLDNLKPFRPMRALGSYTIIKAQAYSYSGDMEKGVKLAVRGIELARHYGSQRHISRVQAMYDRLNITKLRNHKAMKELHAVLMGG
ncbi:helix-turn-helix protein [Thermosporothrix hazakensis]|uniref:Helix-turn-helix protein n=2 Tax=Thermosporothrix TaxID=768650 RepID=A0A326U9Q6_THEHA|nr:helix-turn-helix transcriptional regulator [Thermosporothrix hazakensis]PZW31143.1 helix-turn-helix protein [Thermosporothrix hazakensis]BBH86635.1 hypothetical protein KTC_13860 [Thermosporothrix sp. COM3]GCE50945.1 hypothetical protein KTH_58140 [Thermosporothrix hazakensis]